MPNTREKLIELLNEFIDGGFKQLNYKTSKNIHNFDIADHLIANGVTVQEWISVKERLPDKPGYYLTFAHGKTGGYCHVHYHYPNDLYKKVPFAIGENHPAYYPPTHWMPLPQPPMLGNKQYHQLDESSPQTEEGE